MVMPAAAIYTLVLMDGYFASRSNWPLKPFSEGHIAILRVEALERVLYTMPEEYYIAHKLEQEGQRDGKHTAEKEARKQAAIFEKECKDGVAMDSRQTFSGYAEYVIKTKVRTGILKQKTEHHYRKLLVRVNEAIGHMKLKDIRPQHINQLYEQLSQNGMKRKGGKAKRQRQKLT
ncbi:MAG: hypothetical protein FWG94_12625 [Oscillospiraceae bacterium]|nr:hypothetical protein [Oscillospiraceae bacterium]